MNREINRESNPKAKLTEEDVKYIRADLGKTSVKDLAEMFKVNRKTIYMVMKGINWPDV